MTFDLSYSNQARKFLKKADKILIKRLLDKMESLRTKPVIHDSKAVEGAKNLFRVRVGPYRVLYEVDYKNNSIGIVRIDKRARVYD